MNKRNLIILGSALFSSFIFMCGIMMIDDDSISKREKGTAEKFEKKIELLENRVKEFEKKEEVELKKIKINDSIKSALKKD
ncbi:MAG: hypothetical protein RR668_09795 [Algoriella sp.]